MPWPVPSCFCFWWSNAIARTTRLRVVCMLISAVFPSLRIHPLLSQSACFPLSSIHGFHTDTLLYHIYPRPFHLFPVCLHCPPWDCTHSLDRSGPSLLCFSSCVDSTPTLLPTRTHSRRVNYFQPFDFLASPSSLKLMPILGKSTVKRRCEKFYCKLFISRRRWPKRNHQANPSLL